MCMYLVLRRKYLSLCVCILCCVGSICLCTISRYLLSAAARSCISGKSDNRYILPLLALPVANTVMQVISPVSTLLVSVCGGGSGRGNERGRGRGSGRVKERERHISHGATVVAGCTGIAKVAKEWLLKVPYWDVYRVDPDLNKTLILRLGLGNVPYMSTPPIHTHTYTTYNTFGT